MIIVKRIDECGLMMFADLEVCGEYKSISTKHTAVKMLLNDLYMNNLNTNLNIDEMTEGKSIYNLIGDPVALQEFAQDYISKYQKCDLRFYSI